MRRKLLTLTIFLTVFLLQGNLFAEDAQYYFQKGHRFYLDSKPAQAEIEFKKALELNPNLPEAYYYLGSIYFKQERYAQSIAQCRQALKLNPEDISSLIILGLSFQHTGLIEESIGAFLKAQNIDSQSAAVHSALGLAYCAKGDLARATEEYNTLRQIDLELADDLLQKISEAQTYGTK